jgi:hypothetical protein
MALHHGICDAHLLRQVARQTPHIDWGATGVTVRRGCAHCKSDPKVVAANVVCQRSNEHVPPPLCISAFSVSAIMRHNGTSEHWPEPTAPSRGMCQNASSRLLLSVHSQPDGLAIAEWFRLTQAGARYSIAPHPIIPKGSVLVTCLPDES